MSAPASTSDAKTGGNSAGPPRHVYLVDGSGFIFRAFYALPPMTRADGTPVNAVFGFTNMLWQLLSGTDADHVAVIFDSARRNFRNDIYPDYKANRSDPPDELVPQFALVREATRAFNVPAIEQAGFEADDLIASYAKEAVRRGAAVTIVSSDKDLMQLVGGKVSMFDPVKNVAIGRDQVREKFGVPPEKVVDVQALAGDSTDNVPGVPGVGIKTAAQLIETFGDLDTLLARANEIQQPKRREAIVQNADKARLSRELVRLRDDVTLDPPLEELAKRPIDRDMLLKFLRAQGFKSIAARAESRMPAPGNVPTAPPENPRSVPLASAAAPLPASPASPSPGAVARARYELIQDVGDLETWIAQAKQAGIVAFDTETTGLDATRALLVGFSLSYAPGHACYVPLAHKAEDSDGPLAEAAGAAPPPKQIPFEAALEPLGDLLRDPGVLKIGHNIKYDCVIMARYGLRVAPYDDTMLLSFVLDGGLHGHGMDELAELHLGHTTIKYEEVTRIGRTQIGFDRVALARARDYAAEDADVTLRLYRALKPRLAGEHMATMYETVERPLVPVVMEMERAGIRVDPGELRRLSADFAKRLAALEEEIHELAGRPFNIGSPKQLGEVLFDEMSLGGGKKGKTGAYATGADVLEELAAQGHDLPARVLDWRQLSKLKSTYTDALTEQINAETGRVHTSFAMTGAATGRLASTDPNLQNIPIRTEEGRKIRRAFVADPGNLLLSVDYSQIELRLLAHVADIAVLREAFRAGQDIHALTASQVFGVPVKDMDPAVRRQAKAINFGIVYGISPFGLANQLGIPHAEAAAYIRAYFERYPGIRDYMESMKAFCRQHGFVRTIFGRKIHIPSINDKNPARRNFSERAAINAPLQGAAADIVKRAMRRVPPALATAKLGARMLLQVHDELLFEVPEKSVEETAKLVRKVMEQAPEPAIRLSVPLVAEAGWAANWADAH